MAGTPKEKLVVVLKFTLDLLPKENGFAASGVLPGFGCSQQTHFKILSSFLVKQAVHSHFAFCVSNNFLKPVSFNVLLAADGADGTPNENFEGSLVSMVKR